MAAPYGTVETIVCTQCGIAFESIQEERSGRRMYACPNCKTDGHIWDAGDDADGDDGDLPNDARYGWVAQTPRHGEQAIWEKMHLDPSFSYWDIPSSPSEEPGDDYVQITLDSPDPARPFLIVFPGKGDPRPVYERFLERRQREMGW